MPCEKAFFLRRVSCSNAYFFVFQLRKPVYSPVGENSISYGTRSKDSNLKIVIWLHRERLESHNWVFLYLIYVIKSWIWKKREKEITWVNAQLCQLYLIKSNCSKLLRIFQNFHLLPKSNRISRSGISFQQAYLSLIHISEPTRPY